MQNWELENHGGHTFEHQEALLPTGRSRFSLRLSPPRKQDLALEAKTAHSPAAQSLPRILVEQDGLNLSEASESPTAARHQ